MVKQSEKSFASASNWLSGGRGYLVFSDIPRDELRKWTAAGGVAIFRAPSRNTNGNTTDLEGRLISCEHSGRRVSVTEKDGTVKTLADRFEGKRLNSPNDIVCQMRGPDRGSIWFTDPPFGISGHWEGELASPELLNAVYRISPQGELQQVISDLRGPNGLAFSPDERQLFIADSGFTEGPDRPRHIRVFDVHADGKTLGTSRVFATCPDGFFDGFRIDQAGRLWASCAAGVLCYSPDGRLIGRIRVPEMVANLTFGGLARNRLFICGTTSLYAIYLKING